MGVINQHDELKNLVMKQVLNPGIIEKEEGMITYDPISIEEYKIRLDNQDISNLAYHTKTMRRGVFTVRDDGKIINYKGVDSSSVAENIKTCDVTKMLGRKQRRHEIVVTYFEYNKEPQIRVKGASQLQDLIKERNKIEKYQRNPLIKFPIIMDLKAFSQEFCIKYNLPLQVKISDELIERLKILDEEDKRKGKIEYPRVCCLSQLKKTGMPADTRNQRWAEYFSTLLYRENSMIHNISGFQKAIIEQDKRYELGAIFGQAKRILDNPFRIADLAYYLEKRHFDSIEEIVDYSQKQCKEDFLLYYAETMGRNMAGFMNENLANHVWSHRQDFSLSAEMCDDAFNNVSMNLAKEDCSRQYKRLKSLVENNVKKDIRTTKEDKNTYELYSNIMTDKVKYYSQFFLFASNMKIIEDAYKITGTEIPKNYQKRFIDEFIDCLNNKKHTLEKIIIWGDILFGINGELEQYLGKRARRTIEGYEDYIEDFKERLKNTI